MMSHNKKVLRSLQVKEPMQQLFELAKCLPLSKDPASFSSDIENSHPFSRSYYCVEPPYFVNYLSLDSKKTVNNRSRYPEILMDNNKNKSTEQSGRNFNSAVYESVVEEIQ